MIKFNSNLSQKSIYVIVFIAAALIIISKDWQESNKVIWADTVSYYAYLPATFIFHDIKLENNETFENGMFWAEPLPDGNKVIKTSMGMSFLYLPFFLISHGIAIISGGDAFGFSPVYKIGLLLSALVYFFLGLIFLRKILRQYFADEIVALTLITVTLGTNLLYYATGEATMPHLYNFALINLFVLLSINWYKKPRLAQLILLGFLAGLIALIRPSNIIILVFFLLYGVFSAETFRQRIYLLFSKFHWFLLMAVAFIIVWLPQFIYWWSITGDFVVDSYPDEKFYWGNPHFIDGLFSYRKGWLIYTPVMLFSLTGIILLFKKIKEFSISILIFILLATYIIVSWWCWWYGGSFGMRSFIDYYGILAIPLALLLSEIWKYKKKLHKVVIAIVFFFVMQNNFFIEKYKKGSFHYDSTTKASFWHSFLNVRPQEGYDDLLKSPDYQKALEGIDEYADNNDQAK